MWNDRRLARRAARGDRDAFAAIFERYQQDLYRYCVAVLGDEQDAQDALQNTMVKALGALPGERRTIELKPWLYRVAHNESIELRRRARPTAPLADELPVLAAGPEQRAADRDRLRDLLADIAELPERHRGALVMRELAGLDFEEIAAALGTSTGAARQVLYEARRSLQQMTDGREMECDAVTALLSERDGRVARRRDLRAHLRDCPECRRFADGIGSRSETLAGIAPLPAVAVAAMAKGALTGTAAGGGAQAAGSGAVAGGGASTVGSGAVAGGSTGGAGVAAGAVAKVASTGAILKSTAAIVAVLGVSAVAVDHGSLLHSGGSSANGGDGRPAVVRGNSDSHGGAAPRVGDARHVAVAGVSRRFFHRAGTVEVGLSAPTHGRAATAGPTATGGSEAHAHSRSLHADTHGRGGSTRNGAAAQQPTQAAHPEHPEHPAHPTHPTQTAHASHPAHPVQTNARPAAHPNHPAHPQKAGGTSESAQAQHSPTTSSSATTAAAEHPEHPSHQATTEAASTPTEVVTTTEAAAAAAESAEAVSGSEEEAPHGRGRK